jgi:hypothetical protein
MVKFDVSIPTHEFTFPEKVTWTVHKQLLAFYPEGPERNMYVLRKLREHFLKEMAMQFDTLYSDEWTSIYPDDDEASDSPIQSAV